MKTIFYALVLTFSSQAFAFDSNLMPEITHASDSNKTYSTPTASLGRTKKEEEKAVQKTSVTEASKIETIQSAQLSKKQSVHN